MRLCLVAGLGAPAIGGCQGPVGSPDVGATSYRVLAVCPSPPVEPSAEPVFPGQRFTAALAGAQEVPPRVTAAAGSVVLVYTGGGSSLITYDVRQTGLKNVIAVHLHQGAPGENGPKVAMLYGPVAAGGGAAPERLATGVLLAKDLIGPFAGRTTEDLAREMLAGRIYVNVHTDDGVAPPATGAGDFPDGEIRGPVIAEKR